MPLVERWMQLLCQNYGNDQNSVRREKRSKQYRDHRWAIETFYFLRKLSATSSSRLCSKTKTLPNENMKSLFLKCFLKILKVLTCIELFSFSFTLSWCFYFLFNAVLSKEKFKLLSWILLFILCNASFKSKYKSIKLVCGITKITQLELPYPYM